MNRRLSKEVIIANQQKGMHICSQNFGYEYSIDNKNATYTLYSYDKKVCTLYIFNEKSPYLENYFVRNAGDFFVYLIKWDAWKISRATSRHIRMMLEEIEIHFAIYVSNWDEDFTRLAIEDILK